MDLPGGLAAAGLNLDMIQTALSAGIPIQQLLQVVQNTPQQQQHNPQQNLLAAVAAANSTGQLFVSSAPTNHVNNLQQHGNHSFYFVFR